MDENATFQELADRSDQCFISNHFQALFRSGIVAPFKYDQPQTMRHLPRRECMDTQRLEEPSTTRKENGGVPHC